MTTQLTTYQRMADPLAAVQTIGAFIARSGMFGCENESQGQVFALHCMATNRDPLSIIESHHLMHGKLSLKSEEMLARVVDDGGDYEIIEHSPEAAEIVLHYRGRTFRERFTWEEAKLEPFVYQGKPKDLMPKLLAGQFDQLQLSTNYATPRRRMQHLWARVVSDGVRVIAPNLLRGKYTPEEIHQAAIEDGKISPTAPMPVQQDDDPGQVVDADYEVATEKPVEPPITYAPKTDDDAELGKMISRINELFQILAVPGDVQLAAIQKRGARDMGGLDRDGAADLVKALEAKLAAKESTAQEVATTGQVDQFATPASEQQIAEIKSLLNQIVQLEGFANTGEKVRDHFTQHGIGKFADLNHREAQEFINALGQRNLEAFFGLSLQGYKVAKQSEPVNP